MRHLFSAGTLDRLLPVMPYLAVMLSLLVTLALFLALKADSQKFNAKVRKHALKERQRVDQLSEDLQSLSSRPQSVGQPEPVYIPVSAPSGYQLTGFNVNRRVQALRLLRRGEDTAHIAAALGAPRQEIELLIRVQKIVAQAKRPGPKPSADDSSLQAAEHIARAKTLIEDLPGSSGMAPGLEPPVKSAKPVNAGTIRRRKVAALA